MRKAMITSVFLIGFTVAVLFVWQPWQGDRVHVPGTYGRYKTAASVRAERRLFDGAPPTIPHGAMGVARDAS